MELGVGEPEPEQHGRLHIEEGMTRGPGEGIDHQIRALTLFELASEDDLQIPGMPWFPLLIEFFALQNVDSPFGELDALFPKSVEVALPRKSEGGDGDSRAVLVEDRQGGRRCKRSGLHHKSPCIPELMIVNTRPFVGAKKAQVKPFLL